MIDFNQQIAALSPEQQILFEKRLKQRGLSHLKTPELSKRKISKRKDYNELPLSFAQQRLWFFQQLNPDNSAYNVFSALRLEGQLNVALLEKVFTEIVRRHESLRTTFITNSEGQPVQVIARAQLITLPIVDLKEVANKEQEVQRLATVEVQRPFDLAKPLLGITLLKLRQTDYVLLLTMHHIISDRWSLGVFVREMKVIYEAFSSEQPSPLPELRIQYADWAIWQRQYLQGEVLETQMAYWKQQLANLPILELPTDRPRPAVATYQGAKQSFELSKALSLALKALSAKEGVTLFTLLLAAFKILLHKYTNQNDIVVGTDIANRNRVETEGLIGFLINTLVLRTNFSGNPTFRELLSQVRKVTLGAYDHQDLSFDQLVDVLNPERNLSQMVPLFQVKFDLQQAQVEPLKLSDLTVSPLMFNNETTKFELRFNLLETDQGIEGLVEYSTVLFDTTTITWMVEHFQTLLEGIVASPQQRLSELSLLTKTERHQLLVQWNDTEVEYSQQQSIHQLFEAQIERTPDAVAVVFEDQQLTYWELNSKANQLAHYLQMLGVGPEVLVGICVERSLHMVIGLLGILKAGGAYVPLDPAYPQERLAFILQDAQMPVLLTQQHLMENLPQSQTRTVCLDTDWGSIAKECQHNLISECTADNLAYIIYTSGSTGQPKGVLVNHANVVRLLAATESWYHFNQQDVFSLFHSIAFDFSVWELWGTLLYGGQLVVVPYWLSRSPEDFYKFLLTQQVTVLNQTPSAFRQLIQAEQSLAGANKLSLRLVIFGGEALELQSLGPWFERHGDQFPQLVNMYGITETTVHVTYRPLTMADLEAVCGSVIGRPIPDLQVYLLDQHGQPLPIGVRGEMYIGGAGVARGYLNRPELTAQMFIPNSFSDNTNARLYKSGDLGRYLSNGDIEYLGRIDHQVKVRGFRIELGEIEALISQYPAVRETVVVLNLEQADSQRIVAYIVPQSQQTLTITELRRFLESKLPNYMMPAAFVMLDALPLTPNGKIDRKALRLPDIARPELEKSFVPPSTEVERTIANLWKEMLHLDKVGINDNFFDLGGNSLLVVKLQRKLKEIFNQDLSIIKLFQYPTINSFINQVIQEQNNQTHLKQDYERYNQHILSREERKKIRQNLRSVKKQ